MSSSASSNVPKHATHRYHTTLIAVGLAVLVLGVTALVGAVGAPISTLLVPPFLAMAFGTSLVVLGIVGRRAGAGVQLVNTSFDLIARGRLADAEKTLDEVDTTNPTPLIQCVSAIQRGLIATRRGDAQTGIEHLDRAIATKVRVLYRHAVRVQTINALGIRAFLRAVTGDREGARADAQALRESPDALPQALARAALAEAICLEKEGDRDALRKHLVEHHDLLFDATDRRERAIVRAFERMLETTATSVYRKGAKLDLHGDEPPLVDWVAQLVPAAAPFIETPAAKNVTNDLPAAVASDQGKQAVTNARKSAAKQTQTGSSAWTLILVVWGALVAGMAGIWRFLGPPDANTARAEEFEGWNPDALMGALVGLLVLVLGGLIGRGVWMTMQAKRESQKLFGALNLSAQGKLEASKGILTQLSSSRFALVKAQAHLALAYIAERRADLSAALEQCDQGIASLSRYIMQISASDILLPDLMSERAFVLTAMDRHDEAEAELAQLPPAYPYRSRALLRVRLVSHVRRGDLAAAAKLAAETNLDLPLAARDELLADVVRATNKPESLGAGELPRIRRQLRTIDALRPWLTAVAPNALVALERLDDDAHLRRDESTADVAELEAEAETEAAREEAALRRAARTI